MSKYLFSVLVCIMAAFLPVQVFAQEEDTEYSWGIVSSISSDQIVVAEYDYDNDEDVEVTYYIDPELELTGVESLEGIEADDAVDIEYAIQGDKKIAKVIIVEKLSDFEELE